MMSLLVVYVLYDPIQLRNAHTEGSIFGLPGEQTLVGEIVMHPFRGAPLISGMALAIDMVAGKDSSK